jgi:general secretion pathway protein D
MKLLFLLITINAFAVTIVKKDNDTFALKKKSFRVEDLIREYADLKKLNVIFSEDVKGKIDLYGVKEIKEKDLDLYISAVAAEAGYTIIKTESLNQIEVINARDIRYKSTKVYKNIEDVPKDYNHAMFVRKLDFVAASDVSRNFRPFMSRYGRIIDEARSNSIILSDTGKNIHRMTKLIDLLDVKVYSQRIEQVNKLNEKSTKAIIKKKSILSVLKDWHVLFIIVFSLFGGIIGFGISNILNRRDAQW